MTKRQVEVVQSLSPPPDWANDHDPVKISNCCKYVLQLINRHHCEWTVSPIIAS